MPQIISTQILALETNLSALSLMTMWPFTRCDDDACRPPFTSQTNSLITHSIAASPFAAFFAVVTLVTLRHGYPYLSHAAQDDARDGDGHILPSHAPMALRQVHAEHGSKSLRRRAVAWTFSVTVGLAATLGSLILAEILGVGSQVGRELALRLTVPALLFLLVGLVPWLECKSLVNGAGWSLGRNATGSRPKFAWLMQLVLFGCWLFCFWKVGNVIPSSAIGGIPKGSIGSITAGNATDDPLPAVLARACLERIGVVGISLMGLLAGFASVSALWHTFASVTDRRRRRITDADVNRKQAGLDATNEMLLSKRHRLQMLERKTKDPRFLAESKSTGLMGKVIGSIRGTASAEETEMRGLRIEITGLETMEANLASSLALLRGRRAADCRAATRCGRLCLVPSYLFAAYCMYRVAATALTMIGRVQSPSARSFPSSDPVSRFLGLLALHWDPKLDQAAWGRIISFVLSGVILVASANSALQTLHLFAKWTPGLLRQARANLALAVGQVAATYMISASLLMRGMLPHEARTAVGGVLHGALNPVFTDGWFEGWFLTGSAATALGLWLGRRLAGGGADDDWDDYGGEEMGAKRM